MKTFLACRTESLRRQLAGELSADSGEQDPQAMVDASDLNLRDLGALIFGERCRSPGKLFPPGHYFSPTFLCKRGKMENGVLRTL